MKLDNTQLDTDVGLEAAEWVLRLHEKELDPEEPFRSVEERHQSFFAWMKRSPNHPQVFIEAFEAYAIMQRLRWDKEIDVSQLLAKIDSVETPYVKAAGKRIVPSGWRRLFAPMAVIVLAVCVFVALWLGVQDLEMTYSTGVGETKPIMLSDGSEITLNTRSIVSVDMLRDARIVRLLDGEAWFNVHHDSRTFRVVAGDILLEDEGTTFNVYKHSHGTTITVIEGRLRISLDADRMRIDWQESAGAPAIHSRTLSMVLQAGEQVEIGRETGGDVFSKRTLTARQLEVAIEWRSGRIDFDGVSLSAAVEQMNRYTTRRIVIADPALLNYYISGSFGTLTNDTESFPAVLQTVFGVRVVSNPADPTVIQLVGPTSPRLE